jgi:UTP--glucose-1-phosphate uridylyltransferase
VKTESMVRKAVIPAAGHGTRFLPATKAQPKEMLPIIDTPTIQYVVEEAVASGIEDILLITGKGKRAIGDHFDRNFELERILEGGGDGELLDEIRRTAEMANIHYIRQKELKGLADAIACARSFVGSEPFAVLLGDTVIDSKIPVTRQLMKTHARLKRSVIAVETVPDEKVSRYGIIGGEPVGKRIHRVDSLIEKPAPEESPSNLAIAGRYVLTPDVFDAIDRTAVGKNNELQLTDSLRIMLAEGELYAYTIDGKRYDIGNKLDYLMTQIEFGLKRREFARPLRRFLEELGAKDWKPAAGGSIESKPRGAKKTATRRKKK